MIGAKPLRIKINKINGLIRAYYGTRYLALLGPKEYNLIFNRIICLLGVKSGITYVISHFCTKIKVDSCDSLPLERKLAFHNIIITIKSVFNKNKNNYFFNVFLQNGSYETPKNNNDK